MSRAFRCDVCGEYADGEPLGLVVTPPSMKEKQLYYELCPFCANDLSEFLTKRKYAEIEGFDGK